MSRGFRFPGGRDDSGRERKRFKLPARLSRSRRLLSRRKRADREPAEPKPILRLISPADIVTLMNFICGGLAVMYTINGGDGYRVAIILILTGTVLDGLDGMVARRFGSSHNFGKWLDSIADFMTFCIAPAFLTYSIFNDGESLFRSLQTLLSVGAALSIAVLGTLRLARFSMVSYRWRDFVGLPTPGMALLVISMCGFYFWSARLGWGIPFLTSGSIYVLPAFLFISSWVLVSDIRYVKYGGRVVYFVGMSIVLILLSQFFGFLWPGVGMAGMLFSSTLSLLYLISPVREGPRNMWGASRRAKELEILEGMLEGKEEGDRNT